MLKGDFDKLRRLRRNVARLADPNDRSQKSIARAVINEVRKGPLTEQYRTGVGPDGAWETRKDGKPALVSKKLPTLVCGEPIPGGARFTWRSRIMQAHHEGHTWPARTQADQLAFYDEKGRRFGHGRAGQWGLSRRILRARFVETRTITAHGVGVRVLPARRQYPRVGMMPPPWRRAIEAGARTGVGRWYERATS